MYLQHRAFSLALIAILVGSVPLAASAQLPTLVRTGGLSSRRLLLAAAPKNCTLPSSTLPTGVSWFPDKTFETARLLASGSSVRAFSEVALSLPFSGGQKALSAASAAVTLFDGHLPIANSRDTFVRCRVDEAGEPLRDANGSELSYQTEEWTKNAARIRITSSLPLSPVAGDTSRAQRAVRNVIDPAGGLVTLELSRYVFLATSADGFLASARAYVGTGLFQFPVVGRDSTTTNSPTADSVRYSGLAHVGAQLTLLAPLAPIAGLGASSLALSVEPILRRAPVSLGSPLDSTDSPWRRAVAVRAMLLTGDRSAVVVTRRYLHGSGELAPAWSVELVLLR
jgi:hypothetical protein